MKKYVLAFIFIIYWIPSLAQSELKKIEGELFHTEEELFVDSVGNIYSSKFIIIVKEHFLDDVNKKDGIQVADLSSTFKGMKEILEHVESVLGSFELKRKFPEIEVDATLVSDKWGKKVNIHDYSKVFELNFNSPVSYNELNEKLSREENIISLDYPIIGMLTSSDPNDTFYDNQYGLTLINAEKVFNIASGDTNIILGFSDLFNSVSSNGVHEDLSGRIVAAEGGKKYVGSGSLGHGTTVSMVAAASTNNNKGLASMGGDFKLATNDAFNVDYFHSLCTATPTSPNCPDVINMSWVTSYNTLTKNKIEDLLDIGVVVVSASVNDLWYTLWPGQDTIGQPFKPFPAYLNFPTKELKSYPQLQLN